MRARFGENVAISRSEAYSVLTLNECIADLNDDNLDRIRAIKVSSNLLMKIIIKILISFQKQLKISASRARGSRFEVVVDRMVAEEQAAVVVDRMVAEEQAAVEQPIVEVMSEITLISVVAAKPKLVLKDCYVPLV